MRDWNVVVTIRESHFHQAMRFLETFGRLSKTDYFNVLVMKVDDVDRFLEDMKKEINVAPILETVISRVMPASVTFDFQVPAEFEARAVQAVEPWVGQLAGASFHVRMRRRGFKGRIATQNEERFLDGFVLEKLGGQGATGRIDFDDPDYIIDIETVGQRAGVALWAREQRLRYPFLKLD